MDMDVDMPLPPLSPCLWWVAFEEHEARAAEEAAAAADDTDPSRNGWPLDRR